MYAAALLSSTKIVDGIPMGTPAITPAIAVLLMLLEKNAIPITVKPPIKNWPGKLLENFLLKLGLSLFIYKRGIIFLLVYFFVPKFIG